MIATLVVIVVDPDFGDRLAELAAPVWIADTPVNRPAAQRFWRENPGRTYRAGATTFTVEASQRADEWCAEILDVVDEHHGLSRSGAASVRVIGCRASPELAKRFRALGLTDIEETSDGIIARGRPESSAR